MSPIESSAEPSESVLEEASGWFIEFNEGELDAAGRERFLQWLRRSPEHVRAYIEIAAAWEDSARLNPPRTVGLDDVIAQALAEHNVVDLMPAQRGAEEGGSARGYKASAGTSFRSPTRRRAAFALTASAAVLLVAATSTYLAQRGVYQTGIGEQRSIVLSDGSTLELNSRSRIRVRYSGAERDVELLDGQALFQVKKDTARPFIVVSNGTRVRAVGTQFDVYRKTDGTTVTVVEGRVAVQGRTKDGASPSPATANDVRSSAERGANEVFLSAGEQLIVASASSAALRPVRVDLASATAWTQRKLMFNETPLAEVVAEFNRYNTRPIVVRDPTLAGVHIRGNFPATDPDLLIEFLRDRFGVSVTEEDGEIHLSRNSGKK